MSEVREALRPYLNKRIRVRGTLAAYRDWTRDYRDVRRACITDPEMDGEVLANHVWVLDVRHWPTEQVGQQVEFSAVVKSYVDRDGTTNYSLGQADAPEILHQPPALRIPELPPDDDMPSQPEPAAPPVVSSPPAGDPMEQIRQVKRLARVCGGLEHTVRLVEAFAALTIPLPEVAQWVQVLLEE